MADHDGHDPELVAALLDADADEAARFAGLTLVSSCPDCAALHADLLALTAAVRDQPTPARPRDLRLTPADAARLGAPGREPVAVAARLGDDMTDPQMSASHTAHDTVLVASLSGHSIDAADRAAAERLVASCSGCAALHADLVALAAATRAMPTPPRPRDYRLTAADAERLRPVGWRRWVPPFGTSRDAISRPLAIGLTTLGIAGLLVTGMPSLSLGGAAGSAAASAPPAAGAAAPERTTTGPADTTAAGAEATGNTDAAAAALPSADTQLPMVGSAVPAPAASPGAVVDATGPQAANGGPTKTNETQTLELQAREAQPAGGWSTMVVLSGALLLAGLSLFLLRWMARRRRG